MNKVVRTNIKFENPPFIIGASSVVGKKEGEGPLSKYFTQIETEDMFGMENWDKAESECQKRAFAAAVADCGRDAGYSPELIVAGDLMNQITSTCYGIMEYGIPFAGVYGACSTMGEAMSIGACMVSGDFVNSVAAITSSHFASAQKQFRFPLDYGNQRPYEATWTVTGSGAVIISKDKMNKVPYASIKAVTLGKIVDYGIKDSMNMGAAMAPAAADTIIEHLKGQKQKAEDYDAIITGDLGSIGQRILFDMLNKKEIDISSIHNDCGLMIYDAKKQDTHAGGSGCGCSAVVLCGYILNKLIKKEWNHVLFVSTGALFSPSTFNEGKSIPGIAHAVELESC